MVKFVTSGLHRRETPRNHLAAINQHATLNPVKKMDAGPEDIEREVDVKLE